MMDHSRANNKRLGCIMDGMKVPILLCLAILSLGAGCAGKRPALGPVDSQRIADGTYTGKDTWWPCHAKVSVAVEDGRIKEIDLVRQVYGRGRPAGELIPGRIIAAQSTRVDAVTGATRSSVVIQAAVQRAIEASYSRTSETAPPP